MLLRDVVLVADRRVAQHLVDLLAPALSDRLVRGIPVPAEVRDVLSELATLARPSVEPSDRRATSQVAGFLPSVAPANTFRGRTMVSVKQAAAILDVTPRAVTDRLARGTLPGEKVGRTWLVDTAGLSGGESVSATGDLSGAGRGHWCPSPTSPASGQEDER